MLMIALVTTEHGESYDGTAHDHGGNAGKHTQD